MILILITAALMTGPSVLTRAGPPPVTYTVDAAATTVAWKGTKAFGSSHSGIVRVRDGALSIDGTRLLGGRITIDMRTIEVTDIPPSDPIPRERIRSHLSDEDFFHVDRFPTAVMNIVSATRQGSTYSVTADFTIRGVTHRIVFPATVTRLDGATMNAKARLRLDRRRWGANFSGRIGNALVHDEFTLDLDVTAHANQQGTAE